MYFGSFGSSELDIWSVFRLGGFSTIPSRQQAGCELIVTQLLWRQVVTMSENTNPFHNLLMKLLNNGHVCCPISEVSTHDYSKIN